MRRILADVWSFLCALGDRARFYAACVRESDILDTFILIGCLLAAIGGGLFMAWFMVVFCKWMEGR